jgi:hypothetical protein
VHGGDHDQLHWLAPAPHVLNLVLLDSMVFLSDTPSRHGAQLFPHLTSVCVSSHVFQTMTFFFKTLPVLGCLYIKTKDYLRVGTLTVDTRAHTICARSTSLKERPRAISIAHGTIVQLEGAFVPLQLPPECTTFWLTVTSDQQLQSGELSTVLKSAAHLRDLGFVFQSWDLFVRVLEVLEDVTCAVEVLRLDGTDDLGPSCGGHTFTITQRLDAKFPSLRRLIVGDKAVALHDHATFYGRLETPKTVKPPVDW